MRKIYTKIISSIMALAISLSLFSPVVSAKSQDNFVIETSPSESETIPTYITGYADENGDLILKYTYGRDRSASVTIAVFVAGVLVGHIYGTVVNGIVISATGKSPDQWVSVAINKVVGKKLTKKVYLSNDDINWGPYTCPGVVIDHSGMCG